MTSLGHWSMYHFLEITWFCQWMQNIHTDERSKVYFWFDPFVCFWQISCIEMLTWKQKDLPMAKHIQITECLPGYSLYSKFHNIGWAEHELFSSSSTMRSWSSRIRDNVITQISNSKTCSSSHFILYIFRILHFLVKTTTNYAPKTTYACQGLL